MRAFVKSNPIYYEEFGTGIPLLVLHNLPGDHQGMVQLFEPLFQDRRGWRRIYMDLPGMGQSPAPDWIQTQDDMFEAVSEFIREVAPNERYVVAGFSFGGYLAQGLVYWESAVLDGVMLLNPAVEMDTSKRQLPPYQVLVEDEQFQAALTPKDSVLRGLLTVQNYDYLDFIRKYAGESFDTTNYVFINHLMKHFEFSFPVHPLRQPFPAPALILTGRQDAAIGYLDQLPLIEQYPRGTFAIIDRASHLLAIEQQDMFRFMAGEWLNRVEEYRAKAAR